MPFASLSPTIASPLFLFQSFKERFIISGGSANCFYLYIFLVLTFWYRNEVSLRHGLFHVSGNERKCDAFMWSQLFLRLPIFKSGGKLIVAISILGDLLLYGEGVFGILHICIKKVPPWYAVLSKKRGGLCRCKNTKFFLHHQIFFKKSLLSSFVSVPVCQRTCKPSAESSSLELCRGADDFIKRTLLLYGFGLQILMFIAIGL